MKKISFILITSVLISTIGCTNQTNIIDTKKDTSTINNLLKVDKTINVGKIPHGITATETFVYNSDTGENTISVIDAKNDELVKKITFENGVPGYVKSFFKHKYLVAFDTKQKKLHIIDPMQDHKIIQSSDLLGTPDKIVFSEDEKSAVISLPNDDKFALVKFQDDLNEFKNSYGVSTPQEKDLGGVAPIPPDILSNTILNK
ncbi:MAG: hypothetical protein U0457_11460 [Candidatus Sericytochromatia bacterium]